MIRSARAATMILISGSAFAQSPYAGMQTRPIKALSEQQVADLAGKRLELLREVIPGMRRLAIMANVDSLTGMLQMGEAQSAARTPGLEVVTAEIRRAEEIAPAFEGLKGRAEALYVVNEALLLTH